MFRKDDPLQNCLVNMLCMNIEESLGFLVDILDMIPQFQEVASKKVTKSHMGVSENSGTPKWIVYDGKPY